MSFSGSAVLLLSEWTQGISDCSCYYAGFNKSTDCSLYVGNDNDHGYLPICSIVFRLCKDKRFYKHKINSPIDEKMRDPAHKMGATNSSSRQKGWEKLILQWSSLWDICALLHHNSPKTLKQKLKAAKSCKDGNGNCRQHVWLALFYSMRKGVCKMASFSDVKLKASWFVIVL